MERDRESEKEKAKCTHIHTFIIYSSERSKTFI